MWRELGQVIELVGPEGWEHDWIPVRPPATTWAAGHPGLLAELRTRAEGEDSLSAHTVNGKLTAQRQALHDRIINQALAGVPNSAHPVATFMGGGTASGKSAMLKASGNRGREPGVVIDADEIKARLPEYQQMTKTGDKRAAGYVHEESSAIAKKIMARAIQNRQNFTLDGTGDSSYDKLAGKVHQAKDKGYRVHAQYVTVDTGKALERAAARGAKTGRVVPPTTIREIHAGVSGSFRQAMDKDLFDSAELWDNNGKSSADIRLIASKRPGGKFVVGDPAAYARFLAKEHE
jgi:predicted ABC-type ATPase